MEFYNESMENAYGMEMNQKTNAIHFKSFSGVVTEIRNFYNQEGNEEKGYYYFTAKNADGDIVNFAVTPITYFMDCNITVGDSITGYYDGNAPALLIYPPQYNALVIVKNKSERSVKVSYFDDNLTSMDKTLQIIVSEGAFIVNEYGRPYCGELRNHNLAVIYGVSTRSIPALTRPYVIILLDRRL